MFRLNAPEELRNELANKFKTAIEALPSQIAELKSVEVGINDGPCPTNWHIALTGICENYADLDTYSAHPAHLACVAIIKPYIEGRVCVDYTC